MKQHRSTLIMVGLALVLGASIFMFFYRFFVGGMPDYAINIAAAFLGSVITVIVTAILLQAQSSSELRKDKAVGVFNVKIELYNKFVDFLNKIIDDGVIDDHELLQLRGWGFKLSMVLGSTASSVLGEFISQAVVIKGLVWAKLTEEQQDQWADWFIRRFPGEEIEFDEVENETFYTVGDVVMSLRMDINEAITSDIIESEVTKIVINDMVEGLKSA